MFFFQKSSTRRLAQILLGIVTIPVGTRAWALPDPRRTLMADALKEVYEAQPSIRESKILGDHERQTTLYVGPAARKERAGSFQWIDYAGTCGQLKNLFELSYFMPKGDSSGWPKAARRGSVSPFFDYHYGNAVAQSETLRQLAGRVIEGQKLKEKHADLFGPYEESKTLYDAHVAEIEVLNARLSSLDSDVDNAIRGRERAGTPEEIQAAQEAIAEAKARRTEGRRVVLARLATVEGEFSEVKRRYAAARGRVYPYLRSIEEINKDIEGIKSIYRSIQTVSGEAWTKSVETLAAFRRSPVGLASMSYVLYTDEVASLRSALGDSKFRVNFKSLFSSGSYDVNDIQVVPLPLHNVQLEMGVMRTVTQSADASGLNPEDNAAVQTRHPGVTFARITGVASEIEFPVFKDRSGEQVKPYLTKVRGDEAGVVNAFVSLGAYCMEDDTAQPVTVEAPTGNGDGSVPVMKEVFRPRKAKASVQEIALKYNYFVKAEPMSVSCSMDVSRSRTLMQQSGSKGFLFWRKSWSSQQITEVRGNGVDCKTQGRPGLGLPEEEKVRIAELEQKLSQEVMAEYVAQYASSWTVHAVTPAQVPGKSWDAVGPSMQLLCGGNLYCQIGNIVWKSAEELFGSRSATTNGHQSLTGHIRRSYSEDSYRIDQGATAYKLSVDFPSR